MAACPDPYTGKPFATLLLLAYQAYRGIRLLHLLTTRSARHCKECHMHHTAPAEDTFTCCMQSSTAHLMWTELAVHSHSLSAGSFPAADPLTCQWSAAGDIVHLVHVVPHRQLSYSRSFTVSDDHGEQPELKVCQLTQSLAPTATLPALSARALHERNPHVWQISMLRKFTVG